MLGDRILGPRRTVVLGALLLVLGHLLMAFETSFVLALTVLVLGVGCLKGNISTQVGRLYPKDDPRRSHAFTLFNVAINIGAFAAPLVCGALGEIYGWSWGFGAAAVGMVVGLAIYLAGGRHMPTDILQPRDRGATRPKLQPGDGHVVAALFVMLMLGTFFSIAYAQEFNVFPLWARETLDRDLFGWTMPVTWFAALDGAFVVGLTPILLRIWQAQTRRAGEPSDLGKMGIGAALGALGMICLAVASLLAGQGAQVSMLWGVACFALCALGFLYQWPTTLALISNAAPGPINATMMGAAFFFSGFVSNYLAGWLGGFYEAMSAERFWLMHAGISLAGALATWAAIKPLNRVLTTTSEAAPGAVISGVAAERA